MARKSMQHADGSIESWDDGTSRYVHTDALGAEVANRSLTNDERSMLDPRAAQIIALQDIVDQLILDSLMGGM